VNTGVAPLALTSTASQIFVGLADGSACTYPARDGRRPRCQRLGVPVAGAPLVDGRYVYLALLDSTVRQFDREGGDMRREDELGHRPRSGLAIAGNWLAVPLSTGEFVLIPREGTTLTRIAPPDASISTHLHGAAARRDGSLLATLTIPPGGRLTLTVYRPPVAAVPAPIVTPQPDAP
jgi:hypothetical protein